MIQYSFRISHIEIYNDTVLDLLNPGSHEKLVIQNDSTLGVYLRNLTCHVAANIEQAANILIKVNSRLWIGVCIMADLLKLI